MKDHKPPIEIAISLFILFLMAIGWCSNTDGLLAIIAHVLIGISILLSRIYNEIKRK